ncbi:MAG: aldo/keto reductase [Rhodocyclaceae bacterium]
MMASPTLQLNDGRLMPQLGLGVWQASVEQAGDAVRTALECGYRSIDTAAIYENEEGVGQGLRDAGVPRDQVFVTTKLWNESQGYDEALRALPASLDRLGLEYVDLFLIHWPAPQRGRFVNSWRALAHLRNDGRVRSIGVSNFTAAHLQRLFDETEITPAVNQIELHPYLQQRELRHFHARFGIVTEAWSPLGQGQVLQDATVVRIARKHGRSPAQVVIRWHLDCGHVAIPKSVTPQRIRENFDVFGFRLDAEDIAAIDDLDRNHRIGPHPDRFF